MVKYVQQQQKKQKLQSLFKWFSRINNWISDRICGDDDCVKLLKPNLLTVSQIIQL